ncbi:MAG: mRNA surveillance protein pelota [Candidatus Thorarchaeota archaeon]|nr:MAG: mRNA surveillance protein pelota [Candidatus Thorarchaeota archaeon]
MKILKRILKEGKITLKIEALDDLWHLYNVVMPGDIVVSRTTRRVRVGDEDSRKQDSVRKPMTLTIRVEDVSFHSFSNRVRLLGTILEGPSDLINLGSHHTINVETGSILTVIKEHWPNFLLKRLKEAEKSTGHPISLIVTIEDGVADLLLAADFGLKEAVRVKTSISRKRGDQKSYDATMREFYSSVVLAVRSQLEQSEIGLIVITGPGFTKDHFYEFLKSAKLKDLPPVIVESTNSIGFPGAKEILAREVIGSAIEGIRLETETKLIEELITHIAKDNGLGTYGDKEVTKAVQIGAVEHLLITDIKLREGSDETRRAIDSLIRDAEKARAEFHVVSTEHPAGDQLQNLGGIAAILRFRVEY